MDRYYCFLMLILLSLPVFGREYDPGSLDASDYRAVRGLASYARARYLIAERSSDVDQISDHLRDSLIALPESEIPLRLLLFLRQGKRDMSSLLEDLRAVVAANPEHVRINVVYAECLADAQQSDAACQHLFEFLDRTGWSSPEPVIRLLEIKSGMGSWSEAEDILGKALRKRVLRGHPRLKVFQAYFLLQKSEAEKTVDSQRVLLRRKAQAFIQPFLENPEKLQDWELFTSIFPVLAKLESWAQMNRLLDEAPGDFPKTTFWFENKLLALVKLKDVKGLVRLRGVVLSEAELNEAVLQDIALAFIEMNAVDKAQEIYELLHLRNISSLHYRLQLAWIYLMRGADSKGMALLAAVKELPFRGLLLKAGFLKLRQQAGKALEVYQQAEQLALSSGQNDKLDAFFYSTFAMTAEEVGQTKLSIEKFRKAQLLEPENPNICNGLGYILADHNEDLPFAAQLIEKAVRSEANNIAFLDSLAWVRFRTKNYSEALEAMLKTLTQFQSGQDSDGVIHQHASEIFAATEYPLLSELFRRKAVWERMTD